MFLAKISRCVIETGFRCTPRQMLIELDEVRHDISRLVEERLPNYPQHIKLFIADTAGTLAEEGIWCMTRANVQPMITDLHFWLIWIENVIRETYGIPGEAVIGKALIEPLSLDEEKRIARELEQIEAYAKRFVEENLDKLIHLIYPDNTDIKDDNAPDEGK